jgi:TatD DNase family protein
MIDTHAHLNFEAFSQDYKEVIQNNFKQGLKAVINVGSNLETSKKACQIAQEFKNCYAAVALHPIHVEDEIFVLGKYQDLIQRNKNQVKAIGETGLDYYQKTEGKDSQAEVLLKHFKLSQEFNLPIILHCRGSKTEPHDAYLDLLKIIKKELDSQLLAKRGVLHCFSADRVIAQQFLNLGFYLGFTGPITFKNATPELLKVVAQTPLNRILLETDCPFLAPEPYRGERNEPIYIRFMAQKIAEVKGFSFEKVVEQTTINANNLFKI